MLEYFSRHEVAKLIGISPGRLRYWDRIGLVKPSLRDRGRVYYDFQALVCLKTAQGLVEKGLSAKRIRQNIQSLKARIPDFDENLHNKRIYVFGNRVIISHKNRLIDSQSGQLVFKFDVQELSQSIAHRLREMEVPRTAQDWFEEGLRYDGDPSSYDKALHAYREAIKLNPHFADAYVNMGTVYYNQRKFVDAQRCYRLALARDPYHAKAYFNLGNVLDELNCCEEALQCYEKSLEVDPEFPDLYYNLAATCEKLGLWEKAVKHWRSYLNYDRDSPHARYARRRVKLLESHLRLQSPNRGEKVEV